MIQYIYFLKCPNCEDEPFDFFDDAKASALSCLSSKPIITQVEVNRNDFGECTDSKDLGTIWSWEDEVNVTDAEPAITVFTKDDLVSSDVDEDPEFAALDNSVDYELAPESNLDSVPDNFRRPIPDGMTIEELVEEMEKNEDTVECTWCEELFDKSECRYEVDLGWLCSRCEAAIKSRGETLTFRENSYWDFLDEDVDLDETYSFPKLIALPDAKAQIIDMIAQDPVASRYIKDGAIVPARIDISNNFGTDQVVDFLVDGETIKVNVQRDNGSTITLELDALLNAGWFPKRIKRDCPAYKLLTAIRTAAKALNRSVKATTARDANTFRKLDETTAKEFQEHIINIRYEIPLTEYSAGDFPSDTEEYDIYIDKAVENLQAIREKFLEWEYADQAIDAGMVTDRSIYNADGELNDKLYAYATLWHSVGKITFDCAVSELSSEAQKVIESAKVSGEFQNIVNKREIDCVRLANTLIKFFNDVKFFEKPFELSYTIVDDEEAESQDRELLTASLDKKSFLEELEEPDVYSSRLTMCPECGKNKFDPDAGICGNCGFNILLEEFDEVLSKNDQAIYTAEKN